MSHSDDAILQQMRESADYKLGFAMATIRSAIDYLNRNDAEKALRELHRAVNAIRVQKAEDNHV
jgi:hypothetical protein